MAETFILVEQSESFETEQKMQKVAESIDSKGVGMLWKELEETKKENENLKDQLKWQAAELKHTKDKLINGINLQIVIAYQNIAKCAVY